MKLSIHPKISLPFLLAACSIEPNAGTTGLTSAYDTTSMPETFGWRAVDQIQTSGLTNVALHDDGGSAHVTMGDVTCLWRDDDPPTLPLDADTGALDDGDAEPPTLPLDTGGRDEPSTAPLDTGEDGAADLEVDDTSDTGSGGPGFDEDEDVEEGPEPVVAGSSSALGGMTALGRPTGLTLLVEHGTSAEEPRGGLETFGQPNSWAIHRFEGAGVGGIFLVDGRYVDWVDGATGCVLREVDPFSQEVSLGTAAPFGCNTITSTTADGSTLYVAAEGTAWRVGDTAESLGQPADRLVWSARERTLVIAHGDVLTAIDPLSGAVVWSVEEVVEHLVALPSGAVVTAARGAVRLLRAGVLSAHYRSGAVSGLSAAGKHDRVAIASHTGLTILEPE